MAAHNLIADSWCKKFPYTLFVDGDFYRYSARSGLWGIYPEVIVRQEIQQIALTFPTARLTGGLVGSVLQLARDGIAKTENPFDKRPNLLVCKNGTLNLASRKLSKHSSLNFLTSGVDYNYDPAAGHGVAWQKYLDYLCDPSVLGLDVIDFLQEFAGLCVTTETKYEIAIWLEGARGCGKGTFIEGLLAAIGDRACVLGLSTLDRSQFALTRLPGKTLAYCTEQPNRTSFASHILNAIISGEPIEVERKYRDTIEVRPTAKILWSMNSLPVVADAQDGIFRRTHVISFPPLPESERDPALREQIKTEGAAILNWALEGLDRLSARAKLLIPRRVELSNRAFLRMNNIAQLFIDEWGKKPFQYKDFKTWCSTNGHKTIPSNRISEGFRQLGYHQNTKTRYWKL